MYKIISEIKSFCEQNQYEIFSISETEIEIKARYDMWRVKALSDDKCSLLHLNNRGKLQWHRQGYSKYYNINYVKKCISYHNTYKKIF